MNKFVRRIRVNAPVEVLFQYHERPGAFHRINPPWEPVELIEHTGGIRDGAKIELKFQIGPLPIRWLLTHQNYIKDQQFEDIQVKGPFASWRHTHRTQPDGADKSILEDSIEYKLPFGFIGQSFGGRFARAKLERMFDYRHEITVQDIATHLAYPTTPLTIAIAGTDDFFGTALTAFLTTGGHTVYRNPASLEGLDAVIHLPGEKKRILDINNKKYLAETLANLQHKPKVWISMSSSVYYGDRGSEILTEDSPPGHDLRWQAWEDAAAPAAEAGIRVVHPRIGVVLSMKGSRRIGKQWISWIALDDVIGAIYHCLMTDSLCGAVNLTTPNPVTSQEFTRVLRKIMRRPVLFPLPGTVTASQRVQPSRLESTGYRFRYPDLECALRHVLGRQKHAAEVLQNL